MSGPGRAAAGLALAAALLSGCAARTPAAKDLSRFVAASPRSILVVPVVNNSVDVNAADYFLSTVPIPVAERGYYVFPVNLVKRLLEDDGLADASLVHSADPARLAALFGADAILYVAIERWEAKYLLVTTQVTVSFAYTLKDGKTGDTLWQDAQTMVYQSDSGGGQGGLGALAAALIAAAVTKASPDYLPLARQANARALAYPGPGFPAGPYRPEHGKDWTPPPPARAPAPPSAPASSPAAPSSPDAAGGRAGP